MLQTMLEEKKNEEEGHPEFNMLQSKGKNLTAEKEAEN